MHEEASSWSVETENETGSIGNAGLRKSEVRETSRNVSHGIRQGTADQQMSFPFANLQVATVLDMTFPF